MTNIAPEDITPPSSLHNRATAYLAVGILLPVLFGVGAFTAGMSLLSALGLVTGYLVYPTIAYLIARWRRKGHLGASRWFFWIVTVHILLTHSGRRY